MVVRYSEDGKKLCGVDTDHTGSSHWGRSLRMLTTGILQETKSIFSKWDSRCREH